NYTIMNMKGYFVIHPTVGVIKTTGQPFDREKQEYYSLLVKAQDVHDPENQGLTVVNIVVLDVNDNSPVFVNLPLHALVTTNSERGTMITKVHAVDQDSGESGFVRYELVRGSGELFGISETTGEVHLKQQMTQPGVTHSLTVAAVDGGRPPYSSHQQLNIKVVAAEGPIFTEMIFKFTVAEDAAYGTNIGHL
ncbi:unnamed protein product, partial [Meganyctiphanes norvegica]